MELKSLQCPNCGGVLDVEDGLDTFFCKYCGHKVIISDLSAAAYNARTKSKEFEYKKEAKEREYKNQHDQWERQEISKDNAAEREFKTTVRKIVLMGAVILFVLGIMVLCFFLPALFLQ